MRPTRPRPLASALSVSALALALVACAPAEDSADDAAEAGTSAEAGSETSADTSAEASDAESDTASGTDPAACAADAVKQPGTLTIGTDSPAYEPWFSEDDPTNGQGFESAVAYAVAEQLGFGADQVTWMKVPFNNSYAPGDKDFDFDINQISITPARAKVVDFSEGYYSAAQAIIALEDSPAADAASLADLKGLKLGAQTGTTSLSAVRDVIVPDAEPLVFNDTNAAKSALNNGQLDAIVADLPTAFYITAVEIPKGSIIGQFQPEAGTQEEFGMLFEKDSALVECVDQALANLRAGGTLEALESEWLSETVDVPVIE